jgi:hypothetical protein
MEKYGNIKEVYSGRVYMRKERTKAISCREDEKLEAENSRNGKIAEHRNIHRQFIRNPLLHKIKTYTVVLKEQCLKKTEALKLN